MPRMVELQTGFSAGELDPRVLAQSELKIYAQGAKLCRDMALLVGGGAERRPGTMDLADLGSKCRLIEFDFSNTQRYVVAFDAGRARVYDVNGALLTALTGAPWTAATMVEMSYSDGGDVMVLSHEEFLMELTRTSATTFTLTPFVFARSADDKKVYQPYYKFAADDVTITPSAATGTITLTASGTAGWGGFVAGHVGQRFRIYEAEVEITGVTSATLADATVHGKLEKKLDLDAFKSTAGSGVIEVTDPYHGLSTGCQVTFSGANDIGANSGGTGAILGTDMTGTFTVTVIDEHRYTFTAKAGTAAVSEDGGGGSIKVGLAGTATRVWAEPSISVVRGYPATACFHEGRLWLSATPSQPDGYFSSDALKHRRFDVGKGYDGQSVQGAAGLEGLSSIRHLISNGDLQVFTPTTEGVFVTDAGDPITPSNQRVKRQSVAGASYIMPQVFDGATIFVQENRRSVSEIVYSETKQGYTATPISTVAQHLTEKQPIDSAVTVGTATRPEQYAFFPLESGEVAVFHSRRSENVAGWVLWAVADAKVHSLCAVGTDIFMCVERASDGAFRLYQFAQEPTFYVLDGAVEHTSATATIDWTLDARVRGRTLHLFSERGYLGTKAIPADGVIVTDFAITRLLVGDSFLAELETLPPRVETPAGVRDRMKKRLVRSLVEFHETDSARVDDIPVRTRQADGDPTVLPVAFSGVFEARQFNFKPSPTVRITQTEPGFMRILGLTQEVAV